MILTGITSYAATFDSVHYTALKTVNIAYKLCKKNIVKKILVNENMRNEKNTFKGVKDLGIKWQKKKKKMAFLKIFKFDLIIEIGQN